MISDLQFTASLRLTQTRATTGDFPDASQGENVLLSNLKGVDIKEWSEPYLAQLTIAGGADVTVDLRNFTSLLFQTIVFDKVFGIFVIAEAAVEADDDVLLVMSPGVANPLQWFFGTITDSVSVGPGETFIRMGKASDVTGTVVDATHRNLLFANSGTDSLIATIAILGG